VDSRWLRSTCIFQGGGVSRKQDSESWGRAERVFSKELPSILLLEYRDDLESSCKEGLASVVLDDEICVSSGRQSSPSDKSHLSFAALHNGRNRDIIKPDTLKVSTHSQRTLEECRTRKLRFERAVRYVYARSCDDATSSPSQRHSVTSGEGLCIA